VRSLSNVALVAVFLLDKSLQAFVGVGDGRLGGIGSTGHDPDGQSSDDGVGDNLGCHVNGCNCATDRERTRGSIGTSGGSSASGPGRASISTEKLVPRDNWQDVLKKVHALPAVSGGGFEEWTDDEYQRLTTAHKAHWRSETPADGSVTASASVARTIEWAFVASPGR
jgi:hypothetical protein